jgi:hypothetical protein
MTTNQTTTTKDSPKEFCTQKVKANKNMREQAVSNAGEEKTRNRRITLIQLLTFKPINNKSN